MGRIGRIGVGALLLLGLGGPASAFFERSGTFVPSEACPAHESFRRETNPGGVQVQPGRAYAVRGLNREGGEQVRIEVPEAQPRDRWVRLACGALRPEAAGTPAASAADEAEEEPAGASPFRPFFDRADGPGDPSPAPPRLTPLDRAALAVCGEWGSRPRAERFRAMLDEPAVQPEVLAIHEALGGAVLGSRRDLPAFKDELTAAWFQEEGFRHVFCGEPSGDTIGGLHFAGRYLEMQERGWGGLAERCRGTEIQPPIYTVGVRYLTSRGRVRTACPKGYALSMDAREILVEATRAVALTRGRAGAKEACLHRIAEPGQPAFLAVVVVKNGAVRTFYPDASPRCDGGRSAGTCLCGG